MIVEVDASTIGGLGPTGPQGNSITGPTGPTGPAPTGNYTLSENSSLILNAGLSATGKYTGITISGTAGATLSFGNLVMFDSSTSKWKLADISASAGTAGDARGLLGICVLGATDTQTTTIFLLGTIRNTSFPSLTINGAVYASTSGAVVVTQPSTTDYVIRVLGFAITSDEMCFNPSPDYFTHI